LPGAVSAHIAKKQRREVDGGEDAYARDERQQRAQREIAIRERSEVGDRMSERKAPDHEQRAGHRGDERKALDRRVVEPVPARSLWEHVLETAETNREQDDPEIVGFREQRRIRFVDVDEEWDQDRHRETWNEVDVEQPMPIERVGDPSSDHRT